MDLNNKKVLIAYFSREGNNYVNGSITYLPVGNTQVAAEMIEEYTGGDLFKIEANYEYPSDYMECTEVAQDELDNEARPELTESVDNMDEYDVIFLGYPNWWGTAPMAVFTFLEEYDFDGKTIVPFCTHEGSGMGDSESDIREVCPGAEVKKGLAIHGGIVDRAKSAITNWIKK